MAGPRIVRTPGPGEPCAHGRGALTVSREHEHDQRSLPGAAGGEAAAACLLGDPAQRPGRGGAGGSVLRASAGPAVGFRHRGASANRPAGLRGRHGAAGQEHRRLALPGPAGPGQDDQGPVRQRDGGGEAAAAAGARRPEAAGAPDAAAAAEDHPGRRWLAGRLHSKRRDAQAIAHHYDVSNRFYGWVLGPSMAYTWPVTRTRTRPWNRRRRTSSTWSPASWGCVTACGCWMSAAAGAAW